ncbi:MAG: glycosyltransferase family 2 protein, partial [Candidatus Latescibacteria bacterium]|nr:glycosyltransferase family 2 protein [Candidatus Latescibacterota bacterium]
MADKLDICVTMVVVNWNAGEHLVSCVRSLFDQVDIDVDVVVVDNASSDCSLDGLAVFGNRVQVVQTGENLGFGRGVNRGVAVSDAPFVVVLNPDVVLNKDAVQTMVSFLNQRPDVGIVGPRLKDADGHVRASCGFAPRLVDEICRKFLLHLVFPLFKFRRTCPPKNTKVHWVTGACFAARRDAFSTTGGLDEAIFMYYEDVDFGLRLQNEGWQVWYLPDAVGMHVGGESSKQALTRMLVVSEASYGYLIHKHLGHWSAFLLLCLRPIEMVLRSLIWSVVFLLQPNRRVEARARLRAYFL